LRPDLEILIYAQALEPDIAKVFKDSESVNHALRMLMELAGSELQKNLTKRST
jgi:hypothetical protein